MKQDQAIAALERRAADLGVKLYRVCQNVNIAPSTFYRWKTGAKASHDNLAAVTAALDSIAKIRPKARGKATPSRTSPIEETVK